MASQVPASFLQNYIKNKGTSKVTVTPLMTPGPGAAAPPGAATPSPGIQKPVTAAPAPVPANNNSPSNPKPLRSRVPKPAAPSKTPRTPKPKKKRPHFLRRMAGHVAGEIFKGTGKIGKHITKSIMGEDEGGGGVPINNASSGLVAGLGTSKDGSQGEPGVNKKKKNPPLMPYGLFRRSSKK